MKDKKKTPASVSTFLGGDAAVEGTLSFRGVIHLDGRVKGRITGDGGTVIVGENAVIHADISVKQAIIYGVVEGDIDATASIRVHSPGRVVGDIHAPEISIESGATFNGNCGMKARPPVTSANAEASETIGEIKKPLTNSQNE